MNLCESLPPIETFFFDRVSDYWFQTSRVANNLRRLVKARTFLWRCSRMNGRESRGQVSGHLRAKKKFLYNTNLRLPATCTRRREGMQHTLRADFESVKAILPKRNSGTRFSFDFTVFTRTTLRKGRVHVDHQTHSRGASIPIST